MAISNPEQRDRVIPFVMTLSYSKRFGFGCTTTAAFIGSHQFSLFDIKLFFTFDYPFMKATTTEGNAFCLFGRVFLFEGKDISHHETWSRQKCRHSSASRKPALKLAHYWISIRRTSNDLSRLSRLAGSSGRQADQSALQGVRRRSSRAYSCVGAPLHHIYWYRISQDAQHESGA